MSRAAPTFYVLHGDDEFSRKAEVQTMRGRMGDPGMAELNTAQFDGKLATPPEVVAAACAMPFLADKRLVIVEGMLTWLTRKGGGKTATILTQRLLEDQDPFALLPLIYRQFRLLIQAREVLDAGGNKSDLMKYPDFRSDFVAGKAIEQARNFTMAQLEAIYRYLLDTDHGIKTGRVNESLALDLLVAGLSA